MEKLIWVIGSNRKEMIDIQRKINSMGSMRAFCMLSCEAVEKAVAAQKIEEHSRISTPTLILMDYDMVCEDEFRLLSVFKNHQALAGVPLFFCVENRSPELDELCYSKGAMVILNKPFSDVEILRIEHTAWQYEVTKNYEKMLQKQAGDLQAAKEIMRLNQQLETRNELLHQVFGRYFSDEVLEVILEDPKGAVIGGEKKEMTVMMADLRGFTSSSEGLEPKALSDLLNFYFGRMLEAITRYKGTVIEFLGDAVLCVFGAPLYSEQHTENAIAAAITMQNSMKEVNAYCMEKEYPLLEMGIGIHCGEAFIGNIGSEKMMRYNVLGQVVNECSRIESYSVGGQVLVSEKALERVSCSVDIHSEVKITAKGIQRPIQVGEVISIGGDYQCNIENVELDILCDVEEWIFFNIYPIDGKMVQEIPLSSCLVQFSRKRAVVELEELYEDELGIYTDVEIFAARKSGKAVFTGVYAKVMEREGRMITLHFTHITKGFRDFAKQIQPH